MTNIKSKGFGTKAELNAYLDELEDDDAVDALIPFADSDLDLSTRRQQIAALRAEVEALRSLLLARTRRKDDPRPSDHGQLWLGVAAAVFSSLLLRKLLRRLPHEVHSSTSVGLLAGHMGRRVGNALVL